MTILEKIKERVASGRFEKANKVKYIAGENGTEKEREQSLPGGEVLYIKDLGDKSSIAFYENGAVRYCSNGRKTTFDIDSCPDIKYIHNGEIVILNENEFQSEDSWLWRFIVEGENRIMENDEHNAQYGPKIKKKDGGYNKYSLVYYQELLESDEETQNKILAATDNSLREVSDDLFEVSRDCLTEKQYQTIKLLYKYGLTVNEVAEIMGIAHQVVSRQRDAALKKLKSVIPNNM